MKKLFLTILVLVCAVSISAELDKVLENKVKLSDLTKYKKALAMDFAKNLANQDFVNFLSSRLSARTPSHNLVELLRDFGSVFQNGRSFQLASYASRLDSQIIEAKGTGKYLKSVLEVRVAFPERNFPENNSDILVAYVPKGNEKSWKHVEAFDMDGNVHKLDVKKAPERYIIVVGLNAKEDMRAGLKLMNEELSKNGLQSKTKSRGNLDVAKLNKIRFNDVQEPWVLGDAEIYVLVNGISTEAEKANVIALELPYADKKDKTYYPNQVLVIWQNYRYMAANLNFYEHDDNTNYKDLVKNLIEAIGQIDTAYQALYGIASKIIQAMPDHWFSNDDDYVDVFYTLEKGKTYTDKMGASSNAKITLVPYVIQGE